MALEQLGAQRAVRRVGLQAQRQAGPRLGPQVAERILVILRPASVGMSITSP